MCLCADRTEPETRLLSTRACKCLVLRTLALGAACCNAQAPAHSHHTSAPTHSLQATAMLARHGSVEQCQGTAQIAPAAPQCMAVPALRALVKRWPAELLDASSALLTRRPGSHVARVAQGPMPRGNVYGGVSQAVQCIATVQVNVHASVTRCLSATYCATSVALADQALTICCL